ncbi:hypothetical protein H8356DRAFT_1654605 [Neocallimastix lanati (nom. inval.)]|jgi:hypothetical protein|uniref:Dickkopf N-terminal cysteine-rich domain-containing protein n=1 Tax=Neocallimastix californiae TaxID=1754190 RepID=A0A1Y2AH95_9FUNG|nr:hypothetical protein H8356DRAFT_1654605 [Neocallimastix sp. JGI-2020a]ORY21345.1 hypothetical protein LY90DRAFT_676302 [Neocallimastix californiae]|eukprot:ORY21345.1 hypothetical protein LY90DRAFT_676302 [Neocallimastix californiae]
MLHNLSFLLFLSSVNQVICHNILIPTNYTKSYLSDSKRIKCVQNSDCPNGSFCNGELCLFNSLLCFDKEDSNCVYLNETIWDPLTEKIRNDFQNIQEIPIIKTCTIDGIIENNCETKKCNEDSDCFSGICYSGYCATKEIIYYCKDYSSAEFTCKSFNNMKCIKGSDCSHTFCKNHYCSHNSVDDYINYKNSIRISLLILCTLYLLNKYRKKKQRKRRVLDILYA